MASNYETLSDFEVATAEDAQSLFMDQAVIKSDTEADIANIPNAVKTAYVLNTGQIWVRDNTNVWKRGGGAAEVSETAPTNPSLGQIWVKPSEVLPISARGYIVSSTKNVTSTTFAAVSLDTVRTITLPKPAMCIIVIGVNGTGASATTSIRARLTWSGAISGNTTDQMGGFMGALNLFNPEVGQYTTSAVLGAGTTTFGMEAMRTNTSTSTSITFATVVVTPVAWADEYADGVS